MELRHLRYFVAVGEEQHFGRAAARLHIAQPALSRQIQDLEREMGFPLFDRLPRGVRLSAAGTLFLNDVRRILQDVEGAKRRAERVALGKAGTLRIGIATAVSWHGMVRSTRYQKANSAVVNRTWNSRCIICSLSIKSTPCCQAVWTPGSLPA